MTPKEPTLVELLASAARLADRAEPNSSLPGAFRAAFQRLREEMERAERNLGQGTEQAMLLHDQLRRINGADPLPTPTARNLAFEEAATEAETKCPTKKTSGHPCAACHGAAAR